MQASNRILDEKKASEHSDISVKLKFKVEDLICPISSSIMFNPSITNCGHHFETDRITQAMTNNPNCPCCQTPITSLSDSPGMEKLLDTFYDQLKYQSEAVKKLVPATFDLFINHFDHSNSALRERIRNIIESRPDILNKQGTKKNQHYSVAFDLAGTSEGRKYLFDKHLMQYISVENINHIIPEGKYKGQSVAYALSFPRNNVGHTISKVLPATFNQTIKRGVHAGGSLAFWYTASKESQTQFREMIINHLSAETLNTPFKLFSNCSVAFNLACEEDGLDMLIEAKLIPYISTAILNQRFSTESDKQETSVAFYLVKSPKGQEALQEAKLFDKINAKTLNAKIPRGEETGKSVAFYLINTLTGRKILNEHPKLKQKLSDENLQMLRRIEAVAKPKEKNTSKNTSFCKTLGKRIYGLFIPAEEKQPTSQPVKKLKTYP
ncbi:MAG: RING finger protein [Gammaproteobacteria bacterium]